MSIPTHAFPAIGCRTVDTGASELVKSGGAFPAAQRRPGGECVY